jgi:hypothetical protein
MIKTRWNYWSCSKTADWIRGTPKPKALSLEEWEVWRKETKSKNPWRFFFAEKFLNSAQNLFLFPSDIRSSIRSYIDNRFYSKTHFLKTGLKPGIFHELDERIIYGLFNEFEEFVEVDLARIFSASSEKKYKFVRGRCEEAGLDYLKWSSSLKNDFVPKNDSSYGKPTEQAKSAKKMIKIYLWWKSREDRPDPMEKSGWNKSFDNASKKKSCLDRLIKIEEEYDKEDENMLIALIKIRKHLWC